MRKEAFIFGYLGRSLVLSCTSSPALVRGLPSYCYTEFHNTIASTLPVTTLFSRIVLITILVF